MICRYCGMDSRNPQVCEWCHKQLAAGTYIPHPSGPAPMDLTQPQGPSRGGMDLTQPSGHVPSPPPLNFAQPQGYAPAGPPPGQPPGYAPPSPMNLAQPQGHAPGPMDMTQPVMAGRSAMDMTQPIPPGLDMTQPVQQPQFRTSLTGEVIAVEPSTPPASGPIPPGYGQPGMPTHAVVRPPSAIPSHMHGLRSGAIGVDLAKTSAGTYMASPGQRWEKALAIIFPLLLVSVWIVHLKPTMLPWVSLVDFFFVAMALGGTACIGSYDDEYLDVGAALMVSILFGPVVGLVVYLIVGAIKQEFNTSILVLLTSNILIRAIVLAAFAMNVKSFTLLPTLMAFDMIGIMSICLTFGGWMLSSFFRPLNE